MSTSGGLDLRVATYNIYLGADLALVLGPQSEMDLAEHVGTVQRQLTATAFPLRAPLLAGLIAAEAPDLVGLQEVCTWHADGEVLWDCAVELGAALEAAGEPYEVVVTQPTFHGRGTLGVGGDRPVDLAFEGHNTLLRRRSSRVQVEAVSSGLFGAALTMTALGTVEATIDRGWCAARCRWDGTPFDLVNTHTEAYDPASRDIQRDELLRIVAAREVPTLIVGDFNARPSRVGMPPEFLDAWIAAGHASDDPEGFTCCQEAGLAVPVSTLRERIDYVFVRDATVTGCRRIGSRVSDRGDVGLWPSDHAGVVADVSLAV